MLKSEVCNVSSHFPKFFPSLILVREKEKQREKRNAVLNVPFTTANFKSFGPFCFSILECTDFRLKK